ncbi:MAG: flagellar motor switch protein FliM [Pseudomonadota bacterium]
MSGDSTKRDTNPVGGLGLQGEQLDALVEQARKADPGEDRAQPIGDDRVELFSFGNDDLAVMGKYHGLRMVNERFCRLARSVFLPFLRTQPRITASAPEVKSFEEYSNGLGNFVSLTTTRMEELRASNLTVLQADFVSLLTNGYYGGDIAYIRGRRSEFTASEARVVRLCTEALHRALEASWSDLSRLTFSRPVHEDNPQFTSFVEADEQVVVTSFSVQVADVDAAKIDVLYPLQALKPLASKLRSRLQADPAAADLLWRERLTRVVMQVPLNVTASLATPEVQLSQLMTIAPGLVIPIDLHLRPQLLVEGLPYFDVEPGEKGGRAAVSLLRKYHAPRAEKDQP